MESTPLPTGPQEVRPSFLDLLGWVIVRPVQAMRHVTREGNVGRGLLLYVGVSLLVVFSILVVLSIVLPYVQRGDYWDVREALLIGTIFLTISLVGLFVYSVILHGVAQLLGGEEGSYTSILSGICFASIPAVLVGPLALLSSLDPAEKRLLEFWVLLLGGALSLWIVALNVIAVRENYGAGQATEAQQKLGVIQGAQSSSRFSPVRAVAVVVISLPVFFLSSYLVLFLIALFSFGLGG